MTDCGHVCCGERGNAYHAHAVDPGECAICETARDTGRVPTVVTTEQAKGVEGWETRFPSDPSTAA